MNGTARAASIALASALVCGTLTTAEERAGTSPLRTTNPILGAAMHHGMERSTTFRSLAKKIATEKGIVYLEAGRCQRVIRSCMLMHMARAGAYRMLFVTVDTKQSTSEVTGSISHELQHVIEILDTSVQTSSAMLAFYLRYGQRAAGHFETPVASRVARAVRRELRSNGRQDRWVETAQSRPGPGNYMP